VDSAHDNRRSFTQGGVPPNCDWSYCHDCGKTDSRSQWNYTLLKYYTKVDEIRDIINIFIRHNFIFHL